MPRTARIATCLVGAVVALSTVLVATPSAGQEVIVDTPTFVDLVVSPGRESVIGTELTLTATASQASPGRPIDAGSIRFLDDGEQIGVAEVDATGTASVAYVPPTIGVHALTAEYSGAPPDFDPAASAVVEHVVTGDPPSVPAVDLVVSPAQGARAGATIRLSATVHGAVEDPRVRGTVAFRDRGRTIATADIVVAGDTAAAEAEVTLPQGVRELSARYLGNLPEVGPSTSAATTYSSLPETCPDQARPGHGALVRVAYQTFLGRCPDPAGFAYWTDRLDEGADPSTLGRGLVLSSEGIGVTVDAAYQRLLERPADPAGRAVWVAKVRAGWTTSQLWGAVAASPEFLAGAPGPDRTAALVERAFARIVRRPADPASAEYWHQRLSSGARRSGALRSLSLTPEALGHIVDDARVALTGRPAAAAEQRVDQSVIKATRGDWRILALHLLGQPFVYGHAQTYPDPAG